MSARLEQNIDWDAIRGRVAAAQSGIDRSFENDPEKIAATLKLRARQLAERRKTEGAGETALQMLRFGLAEGHYLLPLAALSAVGPWQPVSSVPDGDPALLGLFSARSAVWAVFDLASLLGCDTVGAVEGGRILYLRGSARNSALRVDSLEGTAPVRAADIKQAPPDMRQQSECISGLLANGDIVIDADCLRNHPALKEEQEQ